MNVLFIKPQDVDADGHALLTEKQAKHLLEILKVKVGSSIRLGLENFWVGTAIIKSIEAAQPSDPSKKNVVSQYNVSVQLQHNHPFDTPPVHINVRHRPLIDVFVAMPRPKVFSRVLQGLASLGVGRIFVAPTCHVEGSYFSSSKLSVDGIREELRLGLEQASVDPLFPEVFIYASWKRFLLQLQSQFSYLDVNRDPGLDTPSRDTTLVVLHPTESAPRLGAEVLHNVSSSSRVLLAVGPERGFVDSEIHDLQTLGFQLYHLGDRIFKVETALIFSIALISMWIQQKNEACPPNQHFRTDIQPPSSVSCWCTALSSPPMPVKISLPIKGPDLRSTHQRAA